MKINHSVENQIYLSPIIKPYQLIYMYAEKSCRYLYIISSVNKQTSKYIFVFNLQHMHHRQNILSMLYINYNLESFIPS